MRSIIKLSECKELALKMALQHNKEKSYCDFIITDESIIKAVELLAKDNYRYDNTTGKAFDNGGTVSKYTNYNPEEKHNTVEDVIIWEFIRVILNQAQRMIRLGKDYKYSSYGSKGW